jgi:hypothetical protein
MDGSGVTQRFILYFIRKPRGSALIFTPHHSLEEWEKESDDHIHQGIAWLKSRSNRVVAWFGRLLESARAYHGTLEDRLDPGERILRAMASANRFAVHHGVFPANGEARAQFHATLRRQRIKHTVWFALDLVMIVPAILLSPIPGPNLVLYYPMLRLFSHYRAIRGVKAAVASIDMELQETAGVDDLESTLRSSGANRSAIRAAAERLNIDGLGPFLERMM